MNKYIHWRHKNTKHLILFFVFLTQDLSASGIIDPDQLETQAWIQLENQIEEENYDKFKQNYSHPPETKSQDGIYIIGLKGYFFVGGGTNDWEGQLLQRDYFSEAHYQSWFSLIKDRQVKASLLGVKLVQIVVPDKQAVIPHLRWDSYPETMSQRPVLQLLSRLDENDLLYPIQPLIDKSKISCLYPRHESHWNTLACWLYFKPIMEEIWPHHSFSYRNLVVAVSPIGGGALSHMDPTFSGTQNSTHFVAKGQRIFTNNVLVSRPRESHPQPLAKPNVTVSHHWASIKHPLFLPIPSARIILDFRILSF